MSIDLKDRSRKCHECNKSGLVLSHICSAGIGDQGGSGTDEQQGGGEVIDNPQAADNPDGYLAEDDGAGAETMPEQEIEASKVEV